MAAKSLLQVISLESVCKLLRCFLFCVCLSACKFGYMVIDVKFCIFHILTLLCWSLVITVISISSIMLINISINKNVHN